MVALGETLRPAEAPAVAERIPVLPALRPLVPGGGLRPGSVVCVQGAGAASLGLALLAGAAEGDGWCAAVGLPDLGVVAAVAMGAAPDRLLLVDEPGARWPDVVAALVEAVPLVLVRPPEPVSPAVNRRLLALARRHGGVLAVAGPWEGARLRLRVESADWEGVAAGHGHLRARRAVVSAAGRGTAAGPPRTAELLLPGPDGTVTPAPERRRLDLVPPLEPPTAQSPPSRPLEAVG